MSTAKIAISIEKGPVRRLDRMIRQKLFPSRSRAIQEAVQDKIDKYDKTKLARECAKLDKKFEQSMADEGVEIEVEEWPEY